MMTKNNKDIMLSNNLVLYWDHEGSEKAVMISIDEYPDNPRELGGECEMACFHNRYDLGDSTGADSPHEYLANKIEESFTHAEILALISDGEISIDGVVTPQDFLSHVKYGGSGIALKILSRKFEIMPLWLYDHSGITMSCGERVYPYNDRFDSSAIGWALVRESEDSDWREKARKIIRAEVEIYDEYLQGNAWVAEIYGVSGERPEPSGDIVAGFYGSYAVKSGLAEAIGEGLPDAIAENRVRSGEARYKVSRTLEFTRGAV